MRVTSKGQVTIPRDIREKLGIAPNSEVDFVEDGDRVYLLRRSGPRSQKKVPEANPLMPVCPRLNREMRMVHGGHDHFQTDAASGLEWLEFRRSRGLFRRASAM